MVADGGLFLKIRLQERAGDCRAALSQKCGGGGPCRNPRRKPAPNRAHFAKPARIPRRKRAESPKTILKTVRRTVKTLNKGPNFRMVDTYATPFLFDWPSGAPAWHYPGGHPRLVRKPRDCRSELAASRLKYSSCF